MKINTRKKREKEIGDKVPANRRETRKESERKGKSRSICRNESIDRRSDKIIINSQI